MDALSTSRARAELLALAALIERPPLDDVTLELAVALRTASAIRLVVATQPAHQAESPEARARAAEYCSNCSCDRCRQKNECRSNATTVNRDPKARCWSCSCGWIGCYTLADIHKYGEPSECNRCYRERLEECDQPATPAIQPTVADRVASGMGATNEDIAIQPTERGAVEVEGEAAQIIREMIRLADMGFEDSLKEPEENGNYAVYERAKRYLAALATQPATPRGQS